MRCQGVIESECRSEAEAGLRADPTGDNLIGAATAFVACGSCARRFMQRSGGQWFYALLSEDETQVLMVHES